MKKSSIFNLGGNACYFDDDAAEALKKYLNSLRAHFGESESTDEVMNDIEMRLWEIFNEHRRYGMQVVSMREVNEAIAQLGRVEDFGTIDENEDKTENENTESDTQEPTAEEVHTSPTNDTDSILIKRKLFRNPFEKVIGGVASGLGYYLDVQAVWVRIAFVLFTLCTGWGILVYLVLWLIIPEARTAAQQLEIRGIRPTAENIRQHIDTQIADGNPVTRQSGNGCLQASMIGCGVLIFIPLIIFILVFVLSLLGIGISFSHNALENMLLFNHTLPWVYDKATLILMNALWAIPVAAIIFLVINNYFPKNRKVVRAVKVTTIVAWIIVLMTFIARIFLLMVQ